MQPKKLYRNTQNKLLLGVCSGLAEYFEIDATLMRVIFIVGGVVTGGAAIIFYPLAAVIMPPKPKL